MDSWMALRFIQATNPSTIRIPHPVPESPPPLAGEGWNGGDIDDYWLE